MIISECQGIRSLPVEVLEQVFSYVDDTDIVSAAYASLQWNSVCQRVARKRCGEKIPPDILTEILSEQEWGVVDWVEVWRCWVSSSLDTTDPRVTGDCPGPGHVTRLVTLPTQVRRDT